MELNAEQIKKDLECCHTVGLEDCKECSYSRRRDSLYAGCVNALMEDALALIKELTVELDAMRGAANSYKIHNEELTEENERLRAIPEQLHKEMSERMIEERKIERKYAVRVFAERLKKRIASAEYRANTERKTVKKEELLEQVNWVFHKVVPDTIDQIEKEMLEGNNERT